MQQCKARDNSAVTYVRGSPNQTIEDYRAWEANLTEFVLTRLWNPNISSFATMPVVRSDLVPPQQHDTDVTCPPRWPVNQPVGVRELLAFTPWYFNLPVPAEREASMFPQLSDYNGFAADWGLRTAEHRSPCYNYSGLFFFVSRGQKRRRGPCVRYIVGVQEMFIWLSYSAI